MPGYAGVDTVYHDRQHTLDVTLAMARLLAGYERQVDAATTARPPIAPYVGVILALFHDVGYLRRSTDREQANGAEFTRNHVSRGADFLRHYLPQLGLAQWVEVAAQIIHFTGYERPFDQIVTHDARDMTLGHLLGTADMIAQLADRCYLEKCRDRLYPEFVLGGVALSTAQGARAVRYASGLDLLRQTPGVRGQYAQPRASTANSVAPIATWKFCSTAAIPISKRSTATCSIWSRSCAARAGACCGGIRRCMRPIRIRCDRVRSLMLGYFKKAWLQD